MNARTDTRDLRPDTLLRLRNALAQVNTTMLRNASIVAMALGTLWVYAVLNRYETLQTREYSEGEYSLLRFDRWRGRIEECVVPGIDGSFKDPRRNEAVCLTYRANSISAERARD